MKRGLLVAALCAAPLVCADAATRVEDRIGAWDIVAGTDDATGAFTQCLTITPFRNGINLLFSIDARYQWTMILQNPTWRLTKGQTYPVNFWIDNGPTLPASAVVVDYDMVGVPLADSTALFDMFKRGHKLSVQATGSTFDFSLKDSSRALQSALECTSRNATINPSNPFSPSTTANANRPESDAAFKAEAAVFTANLLSAAGITGFQIVDQPLPGFESYHSTFVSANLVGGMVIAPNWTVDDAANEMQTAFASGCKGKLATAKTPMQGAGAQVQVMCEQNDGTHEDGSFIVLPRSKGGVYTVVITQVAPAPAPAPSAPPAGSSSTLPPPATDASAPQQSPQDISAKLVDASVKVAK
ncbi:MAG: hypothetical protein AB7S70_13105 [Hyphomicrobium sp.]|uniref:hypothetical protein n=1 Tax=Hyphomicrobium sp. TaxID=82 RepID=UPI003D12B1A8